MKRNKKFLIGLSLFAIILILIIAISVSNKKTSKEEVDEIDYTFNILKNSGFETGDFSFWQKEFSNQKNYNVIIDEIVKFEGAYSLNLNSDLDSIKLSVYQLLKSFPKDKKLILNARVRTEDINAAYISIELYSTKDSLLVQAISDTLKGTNDWTHLTTWVRTVNPELSYLKIKCNLLGKGRAWFDKIELYPVDIQQKSFFPIRKQ